MTTDAVRVPASTEIPSSNQWVSWILVLGLIYLLLAAVGAIGDGFKTATADNARELFSFATNPFVALMTGLLATALIQSSTTVTTIIIGMVAGGLPIGIAIPMVMGANVGTSLTSSIVALGHVRDGQEFHRAFAAATVHDAFNILAVLIILPLELLFSPLRHGAESLAVLLVSDASVDVQSVNFMKTLLAPAAGLLDLSVGWLPGELWPSIALIVIGVILILFVVSAIGKLLRQVMVGRAKTIVYNGIGRGPVSSMFSGLTLTVLVQSSTTTTSLAVPLAGSGVFTLRQIYPFTLGSNIGTCLTALLAATAITGPTAVLAMQIALVHLLFNLFGVVLIYVLPFLRGVPPLMATTLANLAQKNKLYLVAYLVGVFFLLPLLLIGISQI